MMTWFGGVAASHVTDFRCKRKCHDYLFLACTLLLIAAVPVNARPKEAESDIVVPVEEGVLLGEEYDDVDNIEFHQAKIVNGVLQEDHPVIMYKEDFVTEDFVPKKNRTHRLRKHRDPAHHRRRISEHLANTEQYQPLEPEKIYFDILAPIVASDESKAAASSKMHVEVIPFADGDSNFAESEDEVKRALNKRTKKFNHRRQRRDANSRSDGEHAVYKRNPYYRFRNTYSNANSISGAAQSANYYVPSFAPVKQFEKHPIPGDFINGPINMLQLASRFGGPTNSDRVIWRDYTPTRNPNERLNITVGPPAPLFPKRTPATPAPIATTRAPFIRPADAPPSFENTVPAQTPGRYPTMAPPSQSSAEACVWAITSCCSPNDSTVRYNCFQRYGCSLRFWNLSPCADNIRDHIIDYLNQQYE